MDVFFSLSQLVQDFWTINRAVLSPWNLDWLDTLYTCSGMKADQKYVYPKTPDPSYGNTRPSVHDTPKRALKQVVLTPHDIPWSLRVYIYIFIYIYKHVCVHIFGLLDSKTPCLKRKNQDFDDGRTYMIMQSVLYIYMYIICMCYV